MRSGRHGSMSSGELECIITRNGNFLTVLRAGGGDGQAGVHDAVTGRFLCGIGGGQIPEYSRNAKLSYDCACSPGGQCRSGAHGTVLVRGWRNILHEMLARHILSPSLQLNRLLGREAVSMVYDYGLTKAPTFDPNQTNTYASL